MARHHLLSLIFILSMCQTSTAQNFIAISDGNWSDPSIWSTNSVPSPSSGTAFIGTVRGGFSVPIASVALTADTTVNNLALASGGIAGTLDLAGHNLNVQDTLTLNNSPGVTATILRTGGGTMQTFGLNATGGNVNLIAGDRVRVLRAFSGATASTVELQNISIGASLDNQSTLNLGADLNLVDNVDVRAGSTINMNGHDIAAPIVFLGYNGSGTVQLNRGATPGSISTTNLYLGSSQVFQALATDSIGGITARFSQTTIAAGAKVGFIEVDGGTLNTLGSDAVTGGVFLKNQATANLGGDLNLSGDFSLRDQQTTVNMNGHNIKADRLFLGSGINDAVVVNRGSTPGSLTANLLSLSHANTIDILASDNIISASLFNSVVTFQPGAGFEDLTVGGNTHISTTDTSSIRRSLTINNTSSVNMQSDLVLSDFLLLNGSGASLKMNGHDVNASKRIEISGFPNGVVSLDRGSSPGSLTTEVLKLDTANLALISSDRITRADLTNAQLTLPAGPSLASAKLTQGSSLSTADANNLTGSVYLSGSSTLNLGADLTLTGPLDLLASKINAGNYNISAPSILQEFTSSGILRGANPGAITTNSYTIRGSDLSLIASDSIQRLTMANFAKVFTSDVANINESVTIHDGAVLSLGDDLLLNGNINFTGQFFSSNPARIDANGHDITASVINMGQMRFNSAINNVGYLDVIELNMNRVSRVSIDRGVIQNRLLMLDRSILTVDQFEGEGLSFEGPNALLIGGGSYVALNLVEDGWAFRWKNLDDGSDFVSALTGLIASNQIRVTSSLPTPYSVFSNGGYTYIGTAVPEVPTWALTALTLVGLGIASRQRAKQQRICRL